MSEVLRNISDAMSVEVQRGRNIEELIALPWTGIYTIEHLRGGKVLSQQDVHNIITTEGKRYMIDICMKGNVGNTLNFRTKWYVIFSGNGPGGGAPTTAMTPNVGQTHVNKTGSSGTAFLEFSDYANIDNGDGGGLGANRPKWIGTLDGTLASHTSNASKAQITISAASANTGKIFGAGLVTKETKNNSDAGDYFLSFANFTTTIDVVQNDVVRVGVTVTLS